MTADRVLALDLGYHVGWALLAPGPSGPALTSGHLELPKGLGCAARALREELWALLPTAGDATQVWVERPHLRRCGGRTCLLLGGLVGVAFGWCEQRGIGYGDVAPSTARKAALGRGNATKEEVLAWARSRARRNSITQDEADALCVLEWAVAT